MLILLFAFALEVYIPDSNAPQCTNKKQPIKNLKLATLPDPSMLCSYPHKTLPSIANAACPSLNASRKEKTRITT
jgi:hypothetical protein